MKIKLWAIFVLSGAFLAACGPDEPAPVPVPRAPAKPQPAAKPADPTAKMARAVTSGKSTAPVELKYEVLSKPEPGKPIELELALVAGALIDSLSISVSTTPGLEVVSEPSATFGELKTGDIANHKLTLRATKTDVVYLTISASAMVVGMTQPQIRTFAIPLIVGDWTPAAATDTKAKTDANGQAVQSMPAKETK